MSIYDVDPVLELPQEGDVVRFRNGIFDWKVERTLPYANIMWVKSIIGGRKDRAAISNVLTIQRDSKYRPTPDYTQDYGWESSDVFEG